LTSFKKIQHNKDTIDGKLEAWLVFLAFDEPEMIEKLILQYPEFKKMYDEIYEMCRNMEKVMELHSKELRELDRNTVLYMIDDMKQQLECQEEQMRSQEEKLKEKDDLISEMQKRITELEKKI